MSLAESYRMIIKDSITTEEVFKLGAKANFSGHISLSQVGNYEIYISSTGTGNASVSVFVDAWLGRRHNLFCTCLFFSLFSFIFCYSVLLICLIN